MYPVDPYSRTYTFYVTNCKRFYKLKDIQILKFQFAPILCCFAFSFGFIFIQMDQIANNVLIVPIEKTLFLLLF
jgi:hypothetical protein